MEIIDNKTKILLDDLKVTISKGSKISIAASCFSIYAFQELKQQLEGIEELRFIFTSPSFIKETNNKTTKEFYIPKTKREMSLYGNEFEIKLRNELSQKNISRECVDWIKEKVQFKSNKTSESMMGFINVNDTNYMPIDGFSTVDLGCKQGHNAYNLVQKIEKPYSQAYIQLFNELWNDKSKLKDVTDVVISNISSAFSENSPDFLYFFTIYNIFHDFLDEISSESFANDNVGFKNSKIWNKLYNFQKDAVLAIINKLNLYNGCILADSVGLGKTFTALAVIKYFECRNKSCLVLCPKKLSNNWNTYKTNYKNNPIAEDKLRYDVLYHTDLNRRKGFSNGIDLSRINWGNYDLVVIDESHNFRNGVSTNSKRKDSEKDNRYSILLKNVIKEGVQTKVLMLSATPVNNKFTDLRNQLALAYEGDEDNLNSKLDTSKSLSDIFKQAQTAFNSWSKFEEEFRTTENLLNALDYDFFEVLDSVTIARSRKHIQQYYETTDIGKFPKRNKPLSYYPHLTEIPDSVTYNQIVMELMKLNLNIYTPSHYILAEKRKKYEELFKDNSVNIGITQANREQGICKLMTINLLKRMESSVHSFSLSICRIRKYINSTISLIDNYETTKKSQAIDLCEINETELDQDDFDDELFSIGKDIKISLEDMNYKKWKTKLSEDSDVLLNLENLISEINPENDAKIETLKKIIDNKITKPINPENKKIIIFTAFSDTAEYLYSNLSSYLKLKYGLNTALITGTIEGKSTIPTLIQDLNTVLTCFSPISKEKHLLMPNDNSIIDVLIATDCISEGQNLQDCDFLINYDIHWNPVRIIQRFGRIDRIGSKNEIIQLVNFWPDISLDEYIDLKRKVETKMKIVDLSATGDENLISEESEKDLDYRKIQLQKLQEEVVNLEDVRGGVSITDLSLNEFRLDLQQYLKNGYTADNFPYGVNAVIPKNADFPEGIIFILKKLSNQIDIKNQNRLHPYYLVYVQSNGSVICNFLESKKILDILRLSAKDKKEPEMELCNLFNKETEDGKNMQHCSELLNKAIQSIISTKEKVDINSLFKSGGTSISNNNIQGLEDFELISFFVVR